MDEPDEVFRHCEDADVATLVQERDHYFNQVKILKAQLIQAGITPFSSHTKSAPDLSSSKRFSLPARSSESDSVLKQKRYSCDEKFVSQNLSTYDKRSGTNDLGKQYEYVMCGLYAVKFAVSEHVRDFEMTTNDEIYGDFDDIALKVHYVNGTTHTYLLQLKHTENKRSLTDKILTAEKKDFSLLKYLKTYQNLTDRTNLSCILFTNRTAVFKESSQFILNNLEIVAKNFDDIYFEKLLDTNQSPRKSVFQFATLGDEEVASFLDNFYLFANQSSVARIKVVINELLRELLQCDVCDTFINFMKNWWSGNFVLSKSDVVSKLAELALAPFICTISSEKQTKKSQILEKAIWNFDLTLVKQAEGIVSHIWTTTTELRDVSLTALKFGLTNKGISSLEELTSEQKSKVFWYLNQAPLVVKVYDSKREQVKSAVKMLEMLEEKKKIVLLGNFSKEEFPTWTVFESLGDLVRFSAYKDIVQQFEVSLQGRQTIPLEVLIQSPQKAVIIKVQELVKMTQGPLLIGEPKSELPESYIPRTVTTTFLNSEKVILHATVSNELVIFISNPEFRHFLQTKNFVFRELEDYSGECEISVLLTMACTKNAFDKVCRKTPMHRVHLLKFFDHETSILVFSCDNTLKSEDLKLRKPPLQESEIHRIFDNPINVLCAQPGIGKSTMIKFLDNNCPRDFWSVRVNLRKFNSLLTEEPEEEEILWHFLDLNQTTEGSLLEAVKMLFLESRKIYLFLDGLDEIESNCVDFALDYVNYIAATGIHVWISSRLNLQEVITTRLNVFPIDILELNQEQQKSYIEQRLECRYNSEEITEIGEQIFKSADVASSHNVLGIPLQLFIITENFLNDVGLYHQLNKEVFVLTKMYKLFFDGKKKHLLKKVGVHYSTLQQLGLSFDFYLENYELPGLKCCLDDEAFKKLDLDEDPKNVEFLELLKSTGDKFGIISQVTEDRAVFTHQTYAEYFACLWLKKNFSKVRMLKDEFKNQKYQNLRLTFDIMLAEDSPLHLAVIYQNLEQVKRHLTDVNRKDLGGRSALHLLCSYGRRYVPLQLKQGFYCNSLFHEENNDGGESSTYLDIFAEFAQSDIFDLDEIFRWAPLDYAFHFQCLYPVEVLLQKHRDKIKLDGLFHHLNNVSLGYYASKFAYPNLLDVVIKKNRHVVHFRVGETNMSFLHVAVKANTEECRSRNWQAIKIVHVLVANGLDVNVRDKNEATPLHWAVAQGRHDLVKALLDEGSDVNAVDNKEETVAHYALHEWELQIKLFKLDQTPDSGVRDRDCGTLLHWACHEGDYDLVKTLLNDINVTNSQKETPLHYVLRSWKPDLDIVDLLVDNGIDVNTEDAFGITPIHWAFDQGHYDAIRVLHQRGANITSITPELKKHLQCCYKPLKPNMYVLKMLIDHDFNVNAKTTKGERILHWVAQKGHLNVVKLLVTNGANVNSTSWNKETVLHAVARGWNTKLVTMFTELGGDINAKDGNGITPLHRAAERGHLEMVKILLEAGAHSNATSNHGENALTFVVKSQNANLDLIVLLLNTGIDVNSKDLDGVTALHWACERGNVLAVTTLLDQGANVNAATNKLETPLHYTAPNCLNVLLQRGANVNAANITGMTALHWAAERGQIDLVKTLLGAGANVNASTTKQETVLIYAVKQRKVSIEVIKLVAVQSDYAATDRNGMNALHWACDGGHYDVVKFLIDKVDPKICTNENESALHYAAKNWSHNTEVVKRLVMAGVDVNCRDNNGATALHWAAKEGHYTNVEILLDLGADPRCVTLNKETPLHFAAKAWKVNTVLELLVNKGVDVNAVDNDGKTPLHYASEKGFYDNVKLLLDKGATVDAVTSTNLTALHFAVYGGHVKVVKLLQEEGLNIDKVETKNVSLPLYFAVRNGRLKEELLVMMAATIHDKFPLMSWERYSHQDVITYLQQAQPYIATTPVMKNMATSMPEQPNFIGRCRKNFLEGVGSSIAWLRDCVEVLNCKRETNECRTPTFIVHYPVFPIGDVKGSQLED